MMITRRGFIAATAGAAAAQETIRGLRGPFRVIDVHAHTINTAHPGLSEGARRYHKPDGTIEALVRAMDQAEVSHAFLLTYSAEDLAAEIRWRKSNPVDLKPVVNRAYQLRAWRAHRDRFWLFVNHSNPLRETFLEDLERDFDEGAVGWKIMPLFYGFLADNPGFMPAYELCARRKCAVILDLSNWHIGQYPLYNEVAERQGIVKRFEDYGRLLDPLFERFRETPICLAHIGTPKDDADREAVLAFVARHPNALLDTSPHMVKTPELYRHIVTEVGARKLMWGTDFPFAPMDTWRMVTDQCDFLSPADRRLIVTGNAQRFVQGRV
ncbi:MAG TPA: amidohydrolase family protein [Bryobacteraceae bacterium]|nr:amidohydrolase family protein [Bryobacteraceae bacterium]